MTITSAQNQAVKMLKTLKTKKGRLQQGTFLLEGAKPLMEAVASGAAIRRIVATPAAAEQYAALLPVNTPVLFLQPQVFDTVCDTVNAQGIAAEVELFKTSMANAMGKRFLLMLDTIADPGNMGTIIRTADAVGVDCILYNEGCVDIYSPKVVRSTMGSIFHVPCVACDKAFTVIEPLKAAGTVFLAAHLQGKNYFAAQTPQGSICLMIGSEAHGLQPEVAQKADYWVKIPMAGKAESLNAAVAAGILLYDIYQKRSGGAV